MKLCEVLTTVFVVLKLLGIIDWSWWVVLSPEWISIALCLILLVLGAAIKNSKK